MVDALTIQPLFYQRLIPIPQNSNKWDHQKPPEIIFSDNQYHTRIPDKNHQHINITQEFQTKIINILRTM